MSPRLRFPFVLALLLFGCVEPSPFEPTDEGHRSLTTVGGLKADIRADGARFTVDGEQDGRSLLFDAGRARFTAVEERLERRLDDGVLEWWRASDHGFEQGFVVSQWRGDTVVVDQRIEGAIPRLRPGGRAVELLRDGADLRFGGLAAWDATGRELVARFQLIDGALRIEVVAEGALAPITIDPTLAVADFSDPGEVTLGELGAAVAPTDDLNGDGYFDLAVGAPGHSNGEASEGALHIYYGTADGLSTNPDLVIEGGVASGRFGARVAFGGDANGDGYADVIVGAPDFSGGEAGEGKAWLYLGGPTGLGTSAAWSAEGNVAGAAFGDCVATAADVDGDGDSELLVGAPGWSNGQSGEGAAFAYRGQVGGPLAVPFWNEEGNQAGGAFGSTVLSAGDANGDGTLDVAVSAPFYDNGHVDEGAVFLYPVTGGAISFAPLSTIEGNLAGAELGAGLSLAGDLDQDGFADIAIGAPGYTAPSVREGKVFVHRGSAAGWLAGVHWSVEGGTTGDELGAAIAGGGDFNHDGWPDLAVDSPGTGTSGATYLYFHTGAGLATTGSSVGSVAQTGAAEGRVIAVGPREDGGQGDVLFLGMPFYDTSNGGSDAGWARSYDGDNKRPHATVAAATLLGTGTEGLGAAMEPAGDVDEDGFDDLIVGVPDRDGATGDEGGVHLYFGGPGGISTTPGWTWLGTTAAARAGADLAAAQDQNGDGWIDLAIGAPDFSNGESEEGAIHWFEGGPSGFGAAPDATFEGGVVDLRFGEVLEAVGDLSGGTEADLGAGTPFGPTNLGAVWILDGGPAGPTRKATPDLVGTQADARFGAALSGDFDYNGDGATDLLVGAPYWDTTVSTDVGQILLFAGSTSGLLTTSAWTVTENWPGSHLGATTVTLPDYDGDGLDEFGAGAPEYPSGPTLDVGRWQIWRGALTPSIGSSRSTYGSSASERIGLHMRRGGQLDDSSLHGDLLVGRGGDALYGDQHVMVSTGNTISTNIYTRFPYLPPALPLGIGDVNGDGHDDVAISETGANGGAGRVLVHAGNGVDINGLWGRPLAPTLRNRTTSRGVVVGAEVPGGEVDAVFAAAHAPWGRSRVAVQAQVQVATGDEWLAPETFVGDSVDAASSGAEASAAILGLTTGEAYRSRARVRFLPHEAPIGLSAGSWVPLGGLGDPYGPSFYAEPLPDLDDDGSPDATDCAPGDPAISPAASEVPDDGVDQDCTGADLVSCWTDGDGDGYGGGVALYEPDGDCADGGLSEAGTDCLDSNASIHPGAVEQPSDGIDQDCNGTDAVLCNVDADGDGAGGPSTALSADTDCLDAGEDSAAVDCDDADATRHPGAPEITNDGIDQDCSGSDTVGCYSDGDGDGAAGPTLQSAPDGDCLDAGEFAAATDCDDTNPAIAPGSGEVPGNGVDEDCNGTDSVTCRVDGDGDGYGTLTTLLAADGDCTDTGESTTTNDCNDALASVFPGAAEVVGDGIDQDCSGVDSAQCWVDADGDSFGSTSIVAADGDCTDVGEAALSGDCGAFDPTVFPGATDAAGDGVDQDCTGSDAALCAVDADGDGSAGAGTVVALDGDCTDPGEFAAATDCDDLNPAVSPGGEDLPDDGLDQDCSGIDATSCFQDEDGDGFGVDLVVALDGECLDVAEASFSGDCDDAAPTIHPGAAESLGDGIDQDCDGTDGVTCYEDLDGDGFGTVAAASADGDCDDAAEAGLAGDCDDNSATSLPGGTELADDGVDQDCSGADTVTCFTDGDGDGFGTAPFQTPDGECTDAFESSTGGDCADLDPAVHPGAPELVGDGVDQDCDGNDGLICLLDLDGDGWGGTQSAPSADGDCTDALESDVGGDCDDLGPSTHPGAAETCNGTDDDCNPFTGEEDDVDADGFSTCEGDCADFDGSRYPGGGERCDGLDSDCDPLTEEDADGDGDGVSACDGDCDDGNAALAPGLPEGCDGADSDCDFLPGEEEVDHDGDGTPACAGDCAPNDDDIGPLVAEACDGADQDCDGLPAFDEYDLDGDGVPACAGDCGPFSPLLWPGQPERCDSLDTDCIGGLAPAELDQDEDGQRPCDGDCNDADPATYRFAPEPGAGPDLNCDGLVGDADLDADGHSVSEGDCDDGDPGVHPDAVEVCDGADTDCDGSFGDGEQVDADGDGAPTCADCGPLDPDIHPNAPELCDGQDSNCDGYGVPGGEWDLDGDGLMACALDCDDGDARVRWGIPEDCADGIDNDCDGTIDQNIDADLDGVGACDGDCQDRDGSVAPGAPELCNGQDDDCDLIVDEGFDADEDGVAPCEGDCDDTEATVFPGAPTLCNDGLDNDCIPATQEDVDGDGDGAAACDVPGDCWEGNALVGPQAAEWCNGYDDDCDGSVDEGWDEDADGFTRCGLDCDDTLADSRPGGLDVCEDGVDSDCDGFDGLCPEPGDDDDDDSAVIDEDVGCACATSDGRRAVLPVALIVGLALRSRRRPAAQRNVGRAAGAAAALCVLVLVGCKPELPPRAADLARTGPPIPEATMERVRALVADGAGLPTERCQEVRSLADAHRALRRELERVESFGDKARALELLGCGADDPVRAELRERLANRSEPPLLRAAAARGLGHAGPGRDAKSRRLLTKMLRDKELGVAIASADALAACKGARRALRRASADRRLPEAVRDAALAASR